LEVKTLATNPLTHRHSLSGKGTLGHQEYQQMVWEQFIVFSKPNRIIDTFEQRKVDAVVCLGGTWDHVFGFTAKDVLNTRDSVSVEAQSAAIDMFLEMQNRMPSCPIHVVLGNHDMNLRYSRAISSLV
jgi:hypothetical protein